MKLVFGGSYQGKLDYVKNKDKIGEAEIFTFKKAEDCQTPEECLALAAPEKSVPKGAKVLNHFERFTYACTADGRDPLEYVKNNSGLWEGRIIICDDISQGVVPMDKTERAWREANGRVLAFLAGQADEVVRVFCGIPQTLKP